MHTQSRRSIAPVEPDDGRAADAGKSIRVHFVCVHTPLGLDSFHLGHAFRCLSEDVPRNADLKKGEANREF